MIEPGNRIRVIDRRAAARVRRVAAVAIAAVLQLNCKRDRSIDYAGTGSLTRSSRKRATSDLGRAERCTGWSG